MTQSQRLSERWVHFVLISLLVDPVLGNLSNQGGQREEPGKLSPYFWRLCNSACSYLGSNFVRFCQSPSSIASLSLTTEERLWYFLKVMSTSCQQPKWSNWSRTWGTTTPRSCQFHIFTCSFCLLQFSCFTDVAVVRTPRRLFIIMSDVTMRGNPARCVWGETPTHSSECSPR